MRPVHLLATLSAALVLAACSGGGGSPSTAPAAPTAGGPAGTTAAGPCADSTGATTIAATVSDNTWSQPIDATVDDVITWANSDGVPHRVALDDGSCAMSANISGGGTKSLVFSEAGTYPFHCSVHASMKGVITIK